MKNLGENGEWAYPGTAQFFGYPLLSQEREKLQISNLASTFRGSLRTQAHEKFWKKGARAYPGIAQILWVPPIISGTGKLQLSNLASTFKGSIRTKAHEKFRKKRARRIQGLPNFFGYPLLSQEREKRVHPNKSPLKISEKRERGRIQGLPILFGYPLLSEEREKLQISNLASAFRGSIRTKAHEKFQRKGRVGVSRDFQNFWVPPIISGTGKATDFKCGQCIQGVHLNKSP